MSNETLEADLRAIRKVRERFVAELNQLEYKMAGLRGELKGIDAAMETAMPDWALLSEVRAGDVLIADAGFTCCAPGPVTIRLDDTGLWFSCHDGCHYLDGQEDERGMLIGLRRSVTPHQTK